LTSENAGSGTTQPALAYKILIVVVATVAFAAIAANEVFQWVPRVNPALGVAPFIIPFLWFVSTLPMAVIGWTVPDPDPES
jgi:hypothetical protein